MPVLVLTPGDCVACFLFSGDSARPQCESAWGCTGEAVCVGKMLVLESTEGTGSASSPLEGSVGGAPDSGSLTTENPQVDQKGQKCSLSRLLNDGRWEPVRTCDPEESLMWTHGFLGSSCLGMVSQGVSARQAEHEPRVSCQALWWLPPCCITVLDLVSGLCWATSLNKYLEPGKLFYVLAQKFLVFS